MIKTIMFDPGIGQFVQDVNKYINDVYSQLINLHSINQKRARFKQVYNKIYLGMENNIAFYSGCLLWAYYIKKQDEIIEISNNPFLNLSKEQISEYDYLSHVNFLDNYFDSFERDTKYFLGKEIKIPIQWKNILNLYTEFLELNEGFINTKTSENLKIPNSMNIEISEKEDIKNVIEEAIGNKDLTIFLKYL